MKQSLEQDRWFIVKQLLLLTEKEVKHLRMTSDRIKALDPNLQWIETLENNIEYSEMLDAFVSRFGRLQDTLGDELLPAILRVSLEPTGSQLDNLLRAEKIGWIKSSEQWVEIRTLRNRLVHEYMDSAENLLQALNTALESVNVLISTQKRFAQYTEQFKDKI
ncbi:hypothetical protein BMR07_09630 [Methylococcaceae bacterium CS1]|nr:hypothetical protein BMR10_12500 [Methylococcaceae bacterium CS4]TXK99545.1 hypothetical protein BMR11_06310 [Methylococcaceae bacterium CS5]TXL03045.1 hypothetical protein BMR09_15665 [Methylococcaceae bacterium CS3]TXL04346.1 hypothetical protein BMR08_16665 [Methylococcaceae bacterium CS2]TXL05517.1 hypothetical protein BMR07_09630 [Methylococcaceae bacterium CS1]